MFGVVIFFFLMLFISGEKSIVCMIHLSWNLARNVKIAERKLYEHIRLVVVTFQFACHRKSHRPLHI